MHADPSTHFVLWKKKKINNDFGVLSAIVTVLQFPLKHKIKKCFDGENISIFNIWTALFQSRTVNLSGIPLLISRITCEQPGES